MSGKTQVKICGIKSPEILDVCVEAGVEYVGLVFVEKSPRFIGQQMARSLAEQAKGRTQSVGLVMNQSLNALKSLLAEVPLDYLQLHGQETPEFCAEISSLGIKTIKAFSVGSADHVEAARAYQNTVDMLLFDAKPRQGEDLPGGNAHAFDWQLMAGQDFPVPWMLAGGLVVENVSEAVRVSGAKIVDLSSGVESSRGVKDPDKVRAFVASAKKAAF